MEEKRDVPTDREEELLTLFAKWDRALGNHWGDWRREAKRLYGMVAGGQWSDTDKAKLEEIERIAPVFNEMGPIIDAVSGAEIMDRQQVGYFPREVGDAAVNEILTKGADWIRDRCNADQEETEAFRDTFICGMGWTETRMDFDEEPEGQVIVERVDPLEMALDTSCRKANGEGARYIRRAKAMSREEFEEAFPDFAPDGHGPDYARLAINNPRHRYEGDDDISEEVSEDEVFVHEYQWFERRTVFVVEDPADGELVEMSPEDYRRAEQEAAKQGVTLRYVRQTRPVYYRSFVAGGAILNMDPETGDAEVMRDGEFTYKVITGKRDRNKRVWYGLARPMEDPQRWANQFMSQLLAILAASAKGGMMLEADAVDDIREFERSWAKPGANTYFKPGALKDGRATPKPATQYPAGLERLITIAQEAIRKTTGVNPEMLGLVNREQAGVLEHQRKQAAYGILAAFFDSFRRYRRMHGRLLLKYIKYLPDGYLVRITGDDGLARYVPMVKLDDTAKFDVVVDEAPAGPNQVAAVFGVIMQLLPYLKDAELPPEFWAEVARYLPLPEKLRQTMATAIAQQGSEPPDPLEERGKAAGVAATEAKAQKDQAGAVKDLAAAEETRARLGVTFPPAQVPLGEPA
ncbi:MAG: hypothetical protein JNK30_21045 [Phenylobacterium sp.]|uniref:portal protein n=1 Tax=Phenylobacterium sp. TaxID=1871053 RepID=UPI001A43FF47|nr:hypothetical protein [Phenylobacterium sp.]MBL8773887.1 hypothetical protein [Phenylobacterium sp.]